MKELFISLSALPSPPQPGMLGSGPGYGYGNGMTNQGGSPATWIHFNPLGPLDHWTPPGYHAVLVISCCHGMSYVIYVFYCLFLILFSLLIIRFRAMMLFLIMMRMGMRDEG
jgi:hypothetical protein